MKPRRSSAAAQVNGENREADDIAVVQDSLAQMEVDQHQSEDVRRQIRQDLRGLQRETARNRVALITGSAERLESTLDNVDRVFQNVRHCREAAIDAHLMTDIAQMGKEKVQSFASGLARMNSIQFVEKLITSIGGNTIQSRDEPFRISREGWLALGKGCAQYFRHSPSLHFMFGSFSRDPPEVRQKRERKVFQKEKDNLKSAVAPKQVNSLKEMEKKEATTVEVERIYKRLKQLSSNNDKKENSAICYFEFVTNPHSFSQTVENIFHTSFLVRDGLCRIERDSDQLPTIVPIDLKEKNRSINELPNQQVVIPMTWAEWKDIVKKFEIETPLIPPRNQQPSCSYSVEARSQSSKARKFGANDTNSQMNKSSGRRRPAASDVESDSD